MISSIQSDDEILSRLGIIPAAPFDWGNSTSTQSAAANMKVSKSLANHNIAPSSGLDSLKKYVQETNDDKGDAQARRILQTLLQEENIEYSSKESELRHPDCAPVDMMDASIKGLSDRAVAELNVESRTSLFGSILRMFDMPRKEGIVDGVIDNGKNNPVIDLGVSKEDTSATVMVMNDVTTPGTAPLSLTSIAATCTNTTITPTIAEEIKSIIMTEPILSTAEIVRTVHLAARPGDIPVNFDSKEYTLAVIRFLSSNVPYLHEDETEYRCKDDGTSQEGWDQLRMTLPILPLIKAINPEDSIELRCYGRVRPLVRLGQKDRKPFPHSMDLDANFRRKVLNLELIFSSSLPFSSPYIQARLASKLSSGPNQLPALSATTSIPQIAPDEQEKFSNDLPFAFQRFVSRRKIVPRIEGGAKEELTLMISGHMQQPENNPGPKPRLTKSRKEALLGHKNTDNSKITSCKVVGAVDSSITTSKRKRDTSTDNFPQT